MANKIAIISLTLLICSAAIAEEGKNISQADSNSMFLLGPGVLVTVKPYKEMDSTIYPIPVVTAVSAPFYFFIDTAGCRLFSDSNMTFDLIGKLRLDGYDADKSNDFDGMHDRNMTIDVGGEFGISGDWGNLYTRILTDTLGRHDGQEFRVTYAKHRLRSALPCSAVISPIITTASAMTRHARAGPHTTRAHPSIGLSDLTRTTNSTTTGHCLPA
jgi:outer membrane scaffolding protein for murein synthesis (MipA/OmpV family)